MNLSSTERNGVPSGEWERILRFFPPSIRRILAQVAGSVRPQITEIRFRSNSPLELIRGHHTAWLSGEGVLLDNPQTAMVFGPEDLQAIVNSLTVGSFYALEEAIAQGYLALPGGHRVGLTGQVVHEAGKIRSLRNISSVNFRIAKAVRGIARPVLPLLSHRGRVLKTLILGPPAAGKTTLLRDLIREISNGVPEYGLPGWRVGLVDERSELAGSYAGLAQLDVGRRTDILDGCPKRLGVYLLLRTMNPQLIATDEIGKLEDFNMLEDIINTGVGFITTAHARDLEEALRRPGLQHLLEIGLVERVVTLSCRYGVGTIESVKAGAGGSELLTVPFRPVANHA